MTVLRAYATGSFVFIFSLFNVSTLLADAQTVPDAKVFILAGQSNAMGYGSNAKLLPEELHAPQMDVRFWYEEGRLPAMLEPWKRLKSDGWEPLMFQSCTKKMVFGMNIINGFGAEIKLGRVLSDTLAQDVFIIKFAIGSTNLAEDWNALTPGFLFTDLCRVVDEAMSALIQVGRNPKIAGFFWMQGEKDGANAQYSASYKKNLKDFIKQIRM
ncbi:MAG: sialate O-acetylesterase, partial [Planctomycetota bacterium]